MQVFIPSPSLEGIAKSLDWKRLGKQRVECKQIIIASLCARGGWRRHTAVRMWSPYVRFLCDYALTVCAEWKARGYEDNLACFFKSVRKHVGELVIPHWWGDERLHASHRAALLIKAEDKYLTTGNPDAYDWYIAQGWKETPTLDYVWVT